MTVRDLDRIAVLSGPGSFTGLRAGTAFARGLARALEIPLLAIPTFLAASHAVSLPDDVDFLLEAGRGEVHRARRRAGRLGDVSLVARDQAEAESVRAGIALCALSTLSLAPALAELAVSGTAENSDLPFPLLYGRPSAAEKRFGR